MTLRQTLGRAAGAALTVALMGLAVPPTATAAPAPAHDGRTVPVASSARVGVAAAEKPFRTITLDGEMVEPGRFRIMGQVSPAYAKRPVLVERKLGGGVFKPYKKLTTTKRSKYGTSVAPRKDLGKVIYRVRTRETPDYAESFGDHIYVIRTKRG
ncbi:hypothetical protein ENKNEFLB_04112 [Nocardioides aquaticus]|uniref:Uncharacterized protein n=1 Tax=Nocardioides aquaticus TaxID=160826 RepID=A0ABX8EP68_9ACTN|nr:hypothetical protein [Nocardioides aquaticus]QVT81695.1 hypothetical protein ENKNEFLB_04112 [Nocardioides aquaticus]